jgi:hypothetical protein
MRAAANHGRQKRGQLEDARRGELFRELQKSGKGVSEADQRAGACFSFAASKRRSEALLVVSPLSVVLLESKIEATSVFTQRNPAPPPQASFGRNSLSLNDLRERRLENPLGCHPPLNNWTNCAQRNSKSDLNPTTAAPHPSAYPSRTACGCNHPRRASRHKPCGGFLHSR